MAITSEIIGKLGGGGAEVEPVSGTSSGSSSAVMTTITAPPGETLLVAVVGTITAANGNQLYIPVLSIGNAKASFSGVGGVSAIVTGTAQIVLKRNLSTGSDSFTGHVYTVKL